MTILVFNIYMLLLRTIYYSNRNLKAVSWVPLTLLWKLLYFLNYFKIIFLYFNIFIFPAQLRCQDVVLDWNTVPSKEPEIFKTQNKKLIKNIETETCITKIKLLFLLPYVMTLNWRPVMHTLSPLVTGRKLLSDFSFCFNCLCYTETLWLPL